MNDSRRVSVQALRDVTQRWHGVAAVMIEERMDTSLGGLWKQGFGYLSTAAVNSSELSHSFSNVEQKVGHGLSSRTWTSPMVSIRDTRDGIVRGGMNLDYECRNSTKSLTGCEQSARKGRCFSAFSG